MNVLERIISVFSPGAAFRRAQNRAALETLNGERRLGSFDAARPGPHTSGWVASGMSGSADSEILPDRAALVARARDLKRNNGLAQRAHRVLANSVIGDGIKPVINSVRGGSARAVERLRTAWADWSISTACDFYGRQDFTGLQRLVFSAMLESGDVFIRRVVSGGALQLQVLEADFLDRAKAMPAVGGTDYIDGGIQYDDAGRVTGYWMFKRHPGANVGIASPISDFVKSEDIIHLYRQDRPGQNHGVPVGMAGATELRQLGQMMDAAVVGQKVAACFTAMVTSADHGSRPSQARPGALPAERIEPGMIERLAPGESVTFGQPPTTSGLEGVFGIMGSFIAGAFGISREALFSDWSRVTFSSGRLGQGEMAKEAAQWQYREMVPLFCARVFQWFLDVETLKGTVTNATAKQIRADWTAPTMQMLDPLKEIKAVVERVRAGFCSWQEAVRELGYDPRQVLTELQEDKDMWDGLGLMPIVDPRFDTQRNQENGGADEE